MAYQKSKTFRNLKQEPAGYFAVSGYDITVWTDSTKATPYSGINWKPGTTFYLPNEDLLVTIQGGSGSSWRSDQKFPSSGENYTMYVSNPLSDRKRDSSGTPASPEYLDGANTIGGVMVPDAVHFVYVAFVDDAGNPDYYTYVDTIDPERGVHPYTRDIAIASFKTPPREQKPSNGRMIMDLPNRVRSIEGVLRAGRPAGSMSQDYRIADLVARFYAIEQKLNGGSTPSVGSNATYTEDQFMLHGEGGNA